MTLLTIERLKSLVHYEPSTGKFTWLSTRNPNCVAGQAAGATRRGYVLIGIDDKQYPAHRVAWFYVHGRWPDKFIDHINRDRSDNRIENLRDASASQNSANSKLRSHNKIGLKGVERKANRYRARITIHRKGVFLGSFMTAEEAHAAYVAAAKEYFGEFARAS